MKKLLIILILASCKPVKKPVESGMTKQELIDAIAAGSKLTKSDAELNLD